ncbi:MAG: DUF3617 family protein [Casimicrobiaceae bacterium]
MRRIALLIAGIALAAGPTIAAPAEDFPKRKSGLWEIRTASTSAGKAGAQSGAATVQMCIDAGTDNAVQQQTAGMVKQNCFRQDIKRTGGQIVVDSVCKLGDITATTHAVFTGSFDSNYKVDTRSTYDPPMLGMKEGNAGIDARWLGSCKPDQRPGDMILGNGMKININDVAGAPARQ